VVYRGSLEVQSSPSGAQVFLGGKPVGTTPLVLNDLPVGSRVLRLEMDGYERWSSAVQISVEEQAMATATLRPSRRP
jgi:hypothetical protein